MGESEKGVKELVDKLKNLEPEKKKGIKSFLLTIIISIAIVAIIAGLFYFEIYRSMPPEAIEDIKNVISGLDGWGIFGIIGAIVFYITAILLFFHYRDKYKKGEASEGVSKLILKILICSFLALMASSSLFVKDNIAYDFYVWIIAFALCFAFFELFSLFNFDIFKKIANFPLTLIFRFFVPLMPILIIVMGAITGLYSIDSTFLTNVGNVFGSTSYVDISDGGSLGAMFGYACYNIVETLYTLGYDRPQFMLILCLAASLWLLYLAFYRHFIKGIPPMSFIDDDDKLFQKEPDTYPGDEPAPEKVPEPVPEKVEVKKTEVLDHSKSLDVLS